MIYEFVLLIYQQSKTISFFLCLLNNIKCKIGIIKVDLCK
jgi:hypothetical protein